MLGTRKILGLSIEENSVAAVEVRASGGRNDILRAAEFRLPDKVSLDAPARLGNALRTFLRENRFSAKHTVIGLPAKWLLAKEEQIPPASSDSLAGLLRIRAERDFSSNFEDLAVDYIDRSSAEQDRPVLLVATLREKVEQVLAMAQAARLKVRAITSSVAALASARAAMESAPWLTLYLTPRSVELTVQTGEQLHVMRHIPVPALAPAGASQKPNARDLEAIADQVRRVVSLLPRGESRAHTNSLVIWDGIGLEPGAVDELGNSLGVQATVPENLSALGIAESELACDAQICRFAGAAALGLAGIRPEFLAIDFLHSRLATRKKTTLRRRVVWAACLAATLIVAFLFLLMDWQTKEKEAAALESRLNEMAGDIEAARDVVERVSAARGWYDRRPRSLDCLRELTLAFPEDGRIWTTSLAFTEDMRGIISGKSLDEKLTLQLLDKLKDSGRFGEVKLLYMRGAEGGSAETSFAISFSFLDAE